jgi:hypothetical protein
VTKESTDNKIVFSLDSYPYGHSYAEWTARWWQWALSIPLENNPISDDINRYYELNQSGPVWFLAGTQGGIVKRKCNIPAKKSILFPILNYGATLADEPSVKSEAELISLAKKEMDVITNLDVAVDSNRLINLQKYRVLSPIFDVVLPVNSLFGGAPGKTCGISDGYWLFLKPLTVGSHKIESFGSCLAGTVNIGVKYELTVPDE